MKRFIYRIEDYNGTGFYHSHLLTYECACDIKLHQLKHNPPIEDIGIERHCNVGEKCGFLDKKQLHNWLDKWQIKELMRKGFKLKRLYREVTAIGQYQILFTDYKRN